MLIYDYQKRHYEILRCIHLTLYNNVGIKKTSKLRIYSLNKAIANENVKMGVDIRIKTGNQEQE